MFEWLITEKQMTVTLIDNIHNEFEIHWAWVFVAVTLRRFLPFPCPFHSICPSSVAVRALRNLYTFVVSPTKRIRIDDVSKFSLPTSSGVCMGGSVVGLAWSQTALLDFIILRRVTTCQHLKSFMKSCIFSGQLPRDIKVFKIRNIIYYHWPYQVNIKLQDIQVFFLALQLQFLKSLVCLLLDPSSDVLHGLKRQGPSLAKLTVVEAALKWGSAENSLRYIPSLSSFSSITPFLPMAKGPRHAVFWFIVASFEDLMKCGGICLSPWDYHYFSFLQLLNFIAFHIFSIAFFSHFPRRLVDFQYFFSVLTYFSLSGRFLRVFYCIVLLLSYYYIFSCLIIQFFIGVLSLLFPLFVVVFLSSLYLCHFIFLLVVVLLLYFFFQLLFSWYCRKFLHLA